MDTQSIPTGASGTPTPVAPMTPPVQTPPVQPQPAPSAPVTPPSGGSSGAVLKSLGAVLALAILAGAGWYVFLRTESPEATPTPSVSPTASASADPTAGWETYTNEEFGFEVKYPGDLHIALKTNTRGFTLEMPIPGVPSGSGWYLLGISILTNDQYNDPTYAAGFFYKREPIIDQTDTHVAIMQGPQECPNTKFCDENIWLVNAISETFRFTK